MVLGRKQRREPLVGRRPVIDEENAAALALIGDRVAFRALDADLKRGDGAHTQLVGHHLEPRQRADTRDQNDVGDRLGEEIVSTGLKTAHAVGRAVERGDHDNGNEVRRWICFQAAADLKTVHVRHHDVEQHDVALAAPADLERFIAT